MREGLKSRPEPPGGTGSVPYGNEKKEVPDDPQMADTARRDGTPWGIILPVLLVAVVASVAVGYFGLTGQLGGTIPGEKMPASGGPSPTACEGHDGFGSFHFILVAGVSGGYNFNGTSPGPCVAVVVGSSVTVTFEVSPQAGVNHSWVLVPAGASASSPPAFPGAGFSGAVAFVGIAPGTEMNFSFQVSSVGSYQYICEVAGHRDLGMIGWFNVTTSSGTLASPGTSGGSGGPSPWALRVPTEPT